MPGLFSDVRKTAIGACVLLALALLFAEPGGVGGNAVASEEPPALQPSPTPTASAAQGWISAVDEEPEPRIETPVGIGPVQQAMVQGAESTGPHPVGPDFPPGLTTPRYSSSAPGP